DRALRVLVYSRTLGYRHDSIEPAIAALRAQAPARRWTITATEDPSSFDDAVLSATDAVVFLSTSGDVLEPEGEAALERFVRGGGGWVGVHAASDTEYDSAFYGELVGAWFRVHPPIQPATLRVERTLHPATLGLPELWTRTDEWYSFRTNPRATVNVLLSLDEASYAPGAGAMGDHPVAWYHGVGRGRALYTALGHTTESWSDPAVLDHIAGAIDWAGGRADPDLLLAELDGTTDPGPWVALEGSGPFPFTVTRDALLMTDVAGQNQHVLREGVTVAAGERYAIEGLFRVHGDGASTPTLNSFCFDLGVPGGAGALSPPSTWAMNLDARSDGTGGVMKHMGFLAGSFREIGQTAAPWARRETEYLLRVEVGTAADGTAHPSSVRATVLEAGVLRERFTVDYAAFPFQPEPGEPLRLGVNTHGTDFTLRSLRARRQR
ncbi:MAG: ThuA domain-containing protein, partial [Deltaproteobacteria bacterium]|nr:ThuA domain-containing protein [Deltaproteobacteria bacterium]